MISSSAPASIYCRWADAAIPKFGDTPYTGAVPDSEIVSPTSIGFDIALYVQQAGVISRTMNWLRAVPERTDC
jgi:hypothetical protein